MDKMIFDRRDAHMCMADFDDDDDGFFAEWPSEIASDSGYGSHRASLAADNFDFDGLINLGSASLRGMLCDILEQEEAAEPLNPIPRTGRG
ncbi:hypothetical protein BD414DRAFT_500606, partial [Trametes punicea]